MSGKNIILGGKKINKSNSYKSKKVFNLYYIEVDEILISKKGPYGKKTSFKNFLVYNNGDDVIRPLCIKLPQMAGYVKHFHSNKAMPFNFIDNRLLKKYTKIWEKISISMSIEFDSKPVYGDNNKCIKAKIKSYGDKVNPNFQGKKIPKENASYKCFSLIMLDSVIRVSKKYYPQTLLEDGKYEIKRLKWKILLMI